MDVKGNSNRPIRDLTNASADFLNVAAGNIPLAVYRLTQGYVAYLVQNKTIAEKNWYGYENKYRRALTFQERDYIKPALSNKKVFAPIEEEKKKTGLYTTIIIMIILGMLRMLARFSL